MGLVKLVNYEISRFNYVDLDLQTIINLMFDA